MAGAGYKLFNTGDVLTAQQVNEYLQQQTVMVFANSTARTTALSSVLAEGMMSYLQDTNSVEVYNGSAWVGVSSDQIPLTTKGDLLTYSTTDTRLGVGTDGQVLTADSTASTGLKWAAASSGASLNVRTISANYYRCVIAPTPSQTGTPKSVNVADYFNTTYYTPVYLPTGTADRLVVRTDSTYSGTATVRLGIYNNSNGQPSTVLVDAGTVSATAVSTVYSITISQAITAGWYWLAVKSTDSGGTNQWTGFDWSSPMSVIGFIGSISSNNAQVRFPAGYYETGVTGAFATAGTLNTLDIQAMQPMVRVS